MEAGGKMKKKDIISTECLRPVGNVPRCIDDRDLIQLIQNLPDYVVTQENFDGPQFLGGSLGVFALVAEALAMRNPGKELNFDIIFDKTVELHRRAGLELGVHMDDNHGHMNLSEITRLLNNVQNGELGGDSLIPGCGFRGLLSDPSNPLGLSPKVSEFFVNNANIVDEFVRRGANLSILTGHHATQDAFAVENLNPGKTLNTHEAIKNNAQTYNHDTGILHNVLKPMRDAGKLMEINNKWLKITTRKLAGMDPVKM